MATLLILDPARDSRAIMDRMDRAEEKVTARLERASRILRKAGVEHAFIGGNAVAYWVATRDESLVRATRDVDVLLPRTEFEKAKVAMEAEGFVYRHVRFINVFLEGPDGKVGDGIHLIFSGEPIKEGDPVTPEPRSVEADGFHVLDLPELVQMKLVAWRDKDRVHLRDMIAAGLIDGNWPARYSGVLSERLEFLLSDPDG